MKINKIILAGLLLFSINSFAQNGWSLCNTPGFGNRVDDVFMVDNQTGYAVSGDGTVVKTTDGGSHWFTINVNPWIYCRSVEFINAQKGFVGGFSMSASVNSNILRKTTDGGSSWTDLTNLIDTVARQGICGLSIPDSNTIYGSGNFFSDSAYIIKSIDGGSTWNFIDMKAYATHLIDIYFLNKDTGFVTGSGLLPLQPAIILYTTNGGQNWSYKFQDSLATGGYAGYCWKIQHLTGQIYFASIEGSVPAGGRILKSIDGGMNWNIIYIPHIIGGGNGIQGVGFIDSLKGWAGGGFAPTYETTDGGLTWDTIAIPWVTMPICYGLNRVFKVNDSLLFASGSDIWKYSNSTTGIYYPLTRITHSASINTLPNPVNNNLFINLTLQKSTRTLLVLLDASGRKIKVIDNSIKTKGDYRYQLNVEEIPAGIYYVVLKTYEDDLDSKVIITH